MVYRDVRGEQKRKTKIVLINTQVAEEETPQSPSNFGFTKLIF